MTFIGAKCLPSFFYFSFCLTTDGPKTRLKLKATWMRRHIFLNKSMRMNHTTVNMGAMAKEETLKRTKVLEAERYYSISLLFCHVYMLTCHSSDDAFLIPVVLYSLYWWNWQGIFLLFNIKLNSFEEFYPLLIWDQTRDTFCTRCGILSPVSCLHVYLRRESFPIRNKASLTLPWFSLAFRLPVANQVKLCFEIWLWHPR